MEDLFVLDTEQVARILSSEWFVDGLLQNVAFTLLENETYISVNRPAVSTYDIDVKAFLDRHPKYIFENDNYKRALLNVSDIRSINVDAFGEALTINVEVEPRDKFTKSHAGIFTRLGDKNVKKGDVLTYLEKGISADDVLMKVRSLLSSLAKQETCKFS